MAMMDGSSGSLMCICARVMCRKRQRWDQIVAKTPLSPFITPQVPVVRPTNIDKGGQPRAAACISSAVCVAAQLTLLQYPLRPHWRPYNIQDTDKVSCA